MRETDSSLFRKLIEGRSFFDGLGKSYPSAQGVSVHKKIIAGVDCYWFSPVYPHDNSVIIYLHGGGFAWGSIHSHQALVSHITKHTNTPVLFIDYALAPEHPYPHAMTDVSRVYVELIRTKPDLSIFLIGDSAGGGLALSAIDQWQEQSVRQPRGVVLISPWLNLRADTPSYTTNVSVDPILSPQAVKEFAMAYNPEDADQASASSLVFRQFPPLLILVGSNEILLDDSVFCYDQVRKIQTSTDLHVFPGQTHVWLLTNIDHADSKEALKKIDRFILDHGQ